MFFCCFWIKITRIGEIRPPFRPYELPIFSMGLPLALPGRARGAIIMAFIIRITGS